MDYKLIACLLMFAAYAWQMLLCFLDVRSAGNSIPDSVKDIYNREEYMKWRRYHAETNRLEMIRLTVSFLTVLLIVFDVYAFFAAKISDPYWAGVAVVLVNLLATLLPDTVFSYISNMVIEQKYGFNRRTMKTFILDTVKETLLSFCLICGLLCAFIALHIWLNDLIIVVFSAFLFLFILFISFLYPFFSGIFNHFTPLEEGELKEKLTRMLEKNGYTVRAVKVMDASRRSTRSNAYFTGFGKMKTIVLYDTLLSSMTPDEICAVFAHEMGHGLNRDTLKGQLLSLVNIALIVVTLWLLVKEETLYASFGFDRVNYGMAFILLTECCMPILGAVLGIFSSYRSRRAEYRADRQAVKEGYGEQLTSALKKLAIDNFSNLAPSSLLVCLTYSHPPIADRIHAILEEEKKYPADSRVCL